MKTLPHTRSCFVCGESNPIGLKLRFETDGRIVQSRFTACPEHVGFKRYVHGGLIATLLDEIMVWVCVVRTGRFAFCGELNVRFTSPLKPGEEAILTGELEGDRRGKIFDAKAQLRDLSGKVFASATGKYLPMKESELGDMPIDLVGDPKPLFNPASWRSNVEG
jgi:acyl-coenzyme A thioesterase PaaI-like protein